MKDSPAGMRRTSRISRAAHSHTNNSNTNTWSALWLLSPELSPERVQPEKETNKQKKLNRKDSRLHRETEPQPQSTSNSKR